MLSLLKALILYKGFVWGSVKRDFALRYNRSMLGFVWILIQPLSMILIYTLIFSQVMKAKLPSVDSTYAYSIYLCAGTISWGLFSEILNRCQMVFIDNANILKKINFPRICLPVIVVLTALLNFIIIFSLFLAFLVISGNFPGVYILSIIPLVFLQAAFSVGLGIVLGVLNVFFRDVGQVFGVILQIWYWATPIVYPLSIIPAWGKAYLLLNPMTNLAIAYQGVFIQSKWPEWPTLFPMAIASVMLLILGLYLFRKHAAEMVDEL